MIRGANNFALLLKSNISHFCLELNGAAQIQTSVLYAKLREKNAYPRVEVKRDSIKTIPSAFSFKKVHSKIEKVNRFEYNMISAYAD